MTRGKIATVRRQLVVVGVAGTTAVLALSGCGDANARKRGTGYTLETVVRCGADAGCSRYSKAGWAQPEQSFTWTTRPTAKLRFSLAPVQGPLGLRMRLMPNLDPPELPCQVVEVSANGHKLGVWLVDGVDDFLAVIPAHVLRSNGKLDVTLRIPRAQRLASSPPDETRRFGVACYELELSKAASVPPRFRGAQVTITDPNTAL